MIDDPFSDLLKTNKRKENISKLNDDLAYEILSVVEEIPAGRVATYGQIAKLIGREKNSRLVAGVLSHAENYGKFPCHRVVNHMGRLAPGWTEQEWLLKGEGVTLKENEVTAYYNMTETGIPAFAAAPTSLLIEENGEGWSENL